MGALSRGYGIYIYIYIYIYNYIDESEEVEQEAQKLISIIENIMGESIQQYF